MNDTSTSTERPDDDAPARGDSFRTIVDMKRSRDDRLIGGVCAGAARHLNIDPVVVRVIVAVLTLVGFAGVILYLAGWFLLPAEDADRSVAADWFGLDKNEAQFRTVGLVAAGVLAAMAMIGDNDWAGWGAPLILLPIAAIYYFFVVRRRRSREEDAAIAASATAAAMASAERELTEALTHADEVTRTKLASAEAATQAKMQRVEAKVQAKVAKAHTKKSRALFGLTLSTIAIVLASMRIWSDFNDPINWLTYVAVALGIIGVALLIGTFYGYGGGLIVVGILLAIVLAIGSVFPSGRIGEQIVDPVSASQIEPEYEHGIGHLVLDLTTVTDPESLLGRTIDLTMGMGQTQVFVPRGLNVSIESHLKAGEATVFGRTSNGTSFDLNEPAIIGKPSVRITIDQKFGNIEVIRK